MSSFMDAIKPRGASLKFPEPGTTHKFKIKDIEVRPATEYGSTKPKLYPSGDQIYEEWISGEAWNDAEGQMEDVLLVVSSRLMRAAIGHALKAVDCTNVQPGGILEISFTGYGQGKNPTNPPKEYAATYTPPQPIGGAWGDVPEGAQA